VSKQFDCDIELTEILTIKLPNLLLARADTP